MSLENEIHLRPWEVRLQSKPLLVYFITGNPGLIEYYREFLYHLFESLNVNDANVHVYVSGTSLAGFEVNTSTGSFRKSAIKPTHPPLDLDQQVINVKERLDCTVNSIREQDERVHGKPLPVVLVGHSVGAYILLQLLSRYQDQLGACFQPGSLSAGICLFPTVVDISKSPSGKIFSPFVSLPGFARVVHLLAKLILAFIPSFVIVLLLRLFAHMPRRHAQITTAFLNSQHGIHQALFLAKHEMRQIRADQWSDEVWGAEAIEDAASAVMTYNRNDPLAPPKTRLYFYWGGNDHWVANSTRDAVIEARGGQIGGAQAKRPSLSDEGKPYMEIDRNGVPHAFCFRHHELVAGKVATYIGEVMRELQRNGAKDGSGKPL